MKRDAIRKVEGWAKLLGKPSPHLRRLAWEIPDARRYNHFFIPKSNGGLRLISEPTSELKEVQGQIYRILDRGYEPLSCSHGFLHRKSIKSNAEAHVRKPWVLNLDLEKFFPNITLPRIKNLLDRRRISLAVTSEVDEGKAEEEKILLTPAIASLLANLCCFRTAEKASDPETLHGLPQGAPSSPILSDMVARRMDLEIMRFCKREGLVYTRYADDLSFSPKDPKDYSGYKGLLSREARDGVGRGTALKLCHELLEIIASNGFRIQGRKTRLFRGSTFKSVTGLSVNEFANVPRKTVRFIRAHLHLWEKHGYERANEILRNRRNYRHKKCPKELVNVLSGHLRFLSMVRGKGDYVYMKFVKRLNRLLEENGEDDWRDFSRNSGFPVRLDDFPLRSASHFSQRRRIFLEHCGDLRAMRRTEVGSWAFERLDYLFDIRRDLREEFSYDRFTRKGKCLLEHLLEAEAAFLHVLHDESVAGQCYQAYAELFHRVMWINGELCAGILSDRAFRSHVESINWEKFFRRTNDEFFMRKCGLKWLNPRKLLEIARNEPLRGQPYFSLMLWVCLSPISVLAQDEEVLSYGLKFKETFEKMPSFFPVFDEISTCCHRVMNGNAPSAGVEFLREGIYFLVRALGEKPALCKTI